MGETRKEDAGQPGDTPSDSPPNVAGTEKDGPRKESSTPASLPASVIGNPNATPNAGTSGTNSPRGAHLALGIET